MGAVAGWWDVGISDGGLFYASGTIQACNGNDQREVTYFSANGGSSTGNPMAGHANGTDIHPYNISSIPIMKVA